MGYNKKKPPPAKVVLIRHVFNLFKMADPTVAILPYDNDNQANSICHATHVPEPAPEFAIYFPEFIHYLKRFRTKCRVTSSIPMWQIKSKLMMELRANDFWINPTSLKCQSSERCGFFLYAHPYATPHHNFRKVLNPIIAQAWTAKDTHEYDFIPENMTVTNHGDRVTARVLMLRTSPCLTQPLQTLLSKLYATTSDVNLGTLNRYKFVPITSDTSMSDETLQGLLRSQAAFKDNVFIFNCSNIQHIEHDFEFEDSPEQNNDDDIENSEPIKYNYNIRNWFYDLLDNEGHNLIHAVYTTNDEAKIKVLCEFRKRFLVLNILHTLVDTISSLFPTQAISTYFPNHPTQQFTVDKFPQVDPQCGNYAAELTHYATSNPQGEPDGNNTSDTTQPPQNNKRSRDGELVTRSYAASINPNSDLVAKLEANRKSLEALQSSTTSHDSTITKIGDTLQRLDSLCGSHDKVIQQLTQTQITQGSLLQNLSQKQDRLEGHVLRLCTKLQVPIPPPQPEDQPMQDVTENSTPPASVPAQQQQDIANTNVASNPLHGAPGGKSP